MKKVNDMVRDKLTHNFPSDPFENYKNSLKKEQREALEEAEKLAEMYKDVKPERFVSSSNHLFFIPN